MIQYYEFIFLKELERMKQIVRTFLRDENGNFLFVKHKGKDYWSLPGGHIEEGENIYMALKREIKEELNLNVKILGNKLGLDIEGVKEKAQPLAVYKITYCCFKDKKVKKLEYIFLSEMKKCSEKDIKLQEKEIDSYDFFSKEEIISIINTHPQVKKLVEFI